MTLRRANSGRQGLGHGHESTSIITRSHSYPNINYPSFITKILNSATPSLHELVNEQIILEYNKTLFLMLCIGNKDTTQIINKTFPMGMNAILLIQGIKTPISFSSDIDRGLSKTGA